MLNVKAHTKYRDLLNRIIKQAVSNTGFVTMERLTYIPAFGFDKDIPEKKIMECIEESEIRSITSSPEPWHHRNMQHRPAGGTHFKTYMPSENLRNLFDWQIRRV